MEKMSWFKKEKEDKEESSFPQKKIPCKYCKKLIHKSCLMGNGFCDDKGYMFFAHWECAEKNGRFIKNE
jgi:hypothetical protein